jgi:hypothetical protein
MCVRVKKSRRMRWEEHVAGMGESEEMHTKFSPETWKEKTAWETKAYVGG